MSIGAVGSPERIAWNAARRERKQQRLRESGLPLVKCAECGGEFRSLNNHLRTTHETTLREYRIKHKLKLGFRCVAPDLQETFRDYANEPKRMARFKEYTTSPEHLARLQEMRSDPKVGERISEMALACTTSEQISTRLARLRQPEVQVRAHENHRAADIEKGRTLIKACAQCGATFKTRASHNLKYCSQPCWAINRPEATKPGREKGRETLQRQSWEHRQATCIGCGLAFVLRRLRGYRSDSPYCTNRCANSFRPRDERGRIAPGTTNPRKQEKG